jgi:hypothetical protein
MWNNYDTLRHFSSSGSVIEHFLPRWGPAIAYTVEHTDVSGDRLLDAYDKDHQAITQYRAPFWGPFGGFTDPSGIESQVWLRTVANGVVLYDGRSGILYRYSSSNPTLISQSVDVEDNDKSHISGFAVSNEARIYASKRNADLGHSSSLGLFELLPNPTGGLARWLHIQPGKSTTQDLSRERPNVLLGFDGMSMVYMSSLGDMNWSELH